MWSEGGLEGGEWGLGWLWAAPKSGFDSVPRVKMGFNGLRPCRVDC